MQPEEIILLPATHESVACFHVKEEVLSHFLRHLGSLGIDIPEPPEPQGSPEISYIKVNVKEGTSEESLQKVLDDFLKRGQSLRQ